MKFQFCWEYRNCSKECLVRQTATIFCWRLARAERLCHPDNCNVCGYRQNWFDHKYDLQDFLSRHDRRRGKRVAKRVLAIDDEPNFLYVLEDTIRDHGYNCLTAIDGEEGLFFARETIPDLIITDVVMPKINGYELCRSLKADGRTKDIPVIMLTVRGAKKDIDEGLAAGAAEYMIKPISHAELRAKIMELAPHDEQPDRP